MNEAVGLFSATKAGYQQLAPDATMRTGEWLGDCTALGINHDPQFKVVAAGHDGLHWIRRVFSDLEVWALGVPHGLRRKHLQSYLDEFVFRFNSRRTRDARYLQRCWSHKAQRHELLGFRCDDGQPPSLSPVLSTSRWTGSLPGRGRDTGNVSPVG